MITNYATDLLKEKALHLGAEYFIDKSLEFEMLIDILKEMEREIEKGKRKKDE
jgi:hypothetical protein